jgi:hypothetical protein
MTSEQENWIREQIEQKSALLKAGYIKHQNHAGLDELLRLMKE